MRTYTKKKELVNALNKKSLWERIVEELKRNYILYILSIPIIVYFVAFCYLPMFGLVVAFKNYSPAKGIFGSECNYNCCNCSYFMYISVHSEVLCKRYNDRCGKGLIL